MESLSPQIIIIDLGSQYTKLIARELLRLGYKSLVLNPEKVEDYFKTSDPQNIKGVILSGGSSSVYDIDAPKITDKILNLGCSVLGICYGMQYLAYHSNPALVIGTKNNAKEYGPIEINIGESELFQGLPSTIRAWASHGDIVENTPEGYISIAHSNQAIEAMENKKSKLFGVQFHPEVMETEDNNLILKNFAELICKCIPDWQPEDIISEIRNKTIAEIGTGRAAIGVSGGVDSTTLAGLLAPSLGEQLFAFMIDTGGMRHKEVEQVLDACKSASIDLHIIDAKNKFFENLDNVVDAEEKRKKFKETYKEIFKKIIKDNAITHIVQGTLATDLIESGNAGSAMKIKSHHNVGLDFGIIELTPFSHLFKHEVREIARSIGLLDAISERKPFPGPGLFIRVVGTPVTEELIGKVRLADHLVTEILKTETIYSEISQLVVALLGIKTVGVQGDSRSYEYPIVVRAVASTDFMTVKGIELPIDLRKKIISEITKHGFNRVFFDETPKPPATTELE